MQKLFQKDTVYIMIVVKVIVTEKLTIDGVYIALLTNNNKGAVLQVKKHRMTPRLNKCSEKHNDLVVVLSLAV